MKKNLDSETIKRYLVELHEQEDSYNREIGELDKGIFRINDKKKKIARKISKNMQQRHRLINKLYEQTKLTQREVHPSTEGQE